MAEAVEAQVLITASGGEEAAAQFAKAESGMNNLIGSHTAMKSRFQEPFQHVGVMMFGSQLLNTAGVVGHTRPILSLMNIAVSESAALFGLAAGPIGLLTFGLTALAGVISVSIAHHQKHAETLDKEMKSTHDAITAAVELKTKLSEFASVFGTLTPGLASLADHNERLLSIMLKLKDIELHEKMDQLTKELEKQQKQALANETAAAGSAASLDRYAAGSKEAAKATSDLTKEQIKGSAAIEKIRLQQEMLKVGMDDLKNHGAQTWDKLIEGEKKMEEAIARLQAKEKEYDESSAASSADTIGKKLAQTEKWRSRQEEEIRRSYAHDLDEARKNHSHTEELEKQHHATLVALNKASTEKRMADIRGFFGAQSSQLSIAENSAKSMFTGMSQSFGKATADMVVDGKSFSDGFEKIMQNVVKMFIAAVIEMEVKWLAFTAITGAIGGGGAAAGAKGGPVQGLGHFMAADGFSGVVNSPMSFTAGEAGPERVEITPLTGASSGGSKGGDTYNVGPIVINGVNDVKQIAQQVGLEISRAIRGRGQIDFRRAA